MPGEDVDYLNSQLIEFEKCRIRSGKYEVALDKLKTAAVSQEASPWWKRGEVVIGGVAVSFAVGGIIGYLIAK